MTQRYEVISDYPGSPYSIGDILLQSRPQGYWVLENGQCKLGDDPGKYKSIFRPLQWWECRKPEEMPLYVKGAKSVKKVINIEWHTEEYPSLLFEGDTIWCPIWIYQPATESEYIAYQKQLGK